MATILRVGIREAFTYKFCTESTQRSRGMIRGRQNRYWPVLGALCWRKTRRNEERRPVNKCVQMKWIDLILYNQSSSCRQLLESHQNGPVWAGAADRGAEPLLRFLVELLARHVVIPCRSRCFSESNVSRTINNCLTNNNRLLCRILWVTLIIKSMDSRLRYIIKRQQKSS